MDPPGFALESFDILGERFGASSKAPDAKLKAAYCLIELKQVEQGRKALEQVIGRALRHDLPAGQTLTWDDLA